MPCVTVCLGYRQQGWAARCSRLPLSTSFAVWRYTPPAGHVFHNAHADFAVFHVLYHAGVSGTVKKSAAFIVVDIVPDIGLRNARLNFRQYDPGHMMENIIYNELLHRGYSVDVGVVTDRTGGANVQREIDFVVNDADKKFYIQSAF